MKFRYSAINTAYDCLQKYKLTYIDGLAQEGNSGDIRFGTGIHLALKAHFEDSDPQAQFEMYWNSLKNETLEYTQFNHEELGEMGKVFISRFVKMHAKKFRPFKIEETIEMPIGEHVLQGTPDFIGEYEGIPSVVDWKTSARVYNRRKIITNEQMYGYAAMAKHNYNYDVKQLVYIVFIKSEERIQTIKYSLTPEKLSSMLSNVDMMMRDIATRTEFPKNRNSCTFCPFFDICYKGDKI